MSSVEFKFEGMEQFQEELKRINREFPDAQEKILDKGIKNLRKKSKKLTPYRAKDKVHIRDKYKVTKPTYNGLEMETTMTNKAPHFHLVNNGHIQLDRKGNECGFVEGQHMAERAMEEMETEFPNQVEKMIGKLLRV
ncbi:HK97 gp10 family phage protein [Clostridium botulinum]|uniref:HK97 gp10 family phage protein n=1 Tax=Clostridium botulinum TaxID=1491 RepID=UPI001E56B64C|nr:HK97 gp10 family phage protein [Clostridium botulinum]MCD3223941.1 HK97 gp10 family phage protein [Clostridium botulinum C/D]MCD3296290.1 HK97 gp10 family phage protein [Clostridium botulinum C/D]